LHATAWLPKQCWRALPRRRLLQFNRRLTFLLVALLPPTAPHSTSCCMGRRGQRDVGLVYLTAHTHTAYTCHTTSHAHHLPHHTCHHHTHAHCTATVPFLTHYHTHTTHTATHLHTTHHHTHTHTHPTAHHHTSPPHTHHLHLPPAPTHGAHCTHHTFLPPTGPLPLPHCTHHFAAWRLCAGSHLSGFFPHPQR